MAKNNGGTATATPVKSPFATLSRRAKIDLVRGWYNMGEAICALAGELDTEAQPLNKNKGLEDIHQALAHFGPRTGARSEPTGG